MIAPALDLVLAAGERISRLAERGEDDYYPPQRAAVGPAPPDRPGTKGEAP